MRIGILSERALTEKHGTGAQLLRLFSGTDIPFFHLYYFPGHGNISDVENSYFLSDYVTPPRWALRRGWGRIYKMYRQAAGYVPSKQRWWQNGNNVNPEKFKRLQGAYNLNFDVAYVLVSSEESAARSASLLAQLGCSYIVHIMDLNHQELVPAAMPGFQQLLRGASATIVITDTIADQVTKFNAQNIHTIFIGQETGTPQAQPPIPQQTIQIIMTGRPYAEGVRLLEQSVPEITLRFPQVTFAYMGAYYDDHSAPMRNLMRNYGFVKEPAEYAVILANSHLAYLTGPSKLDAFGRYSFPSRSADFLMAGLPLMACVAERSAAERTLQPLAPDALRFTRAPAQMLEALDYFLSSEHTWRQASRQCRQFALSHMSIEVVRGQIFALLQQASRRA